MTPAYVIARVTVTDPEAYARYAEAASRAIREAGGRILARGGAYVALEGEARPRNVIIAFPSLEAAVAYWNSPAYQAAREKGYTGDPCPECGHLTLVRNGACLKCQTCGATTGCS